VATDKISSMAPSRSFALIPGRTRIIALGGRAFPARGPRRSGLCTSRKRRPRENTVTGRSTHRDERDARIPLRSRMRCVCHGVDHDHRLRTAHHAWS
jgi:hypothetical protein